MPYSCNLYSSSIHYAVLTEGDIVVKHLSLIASFLRMCHGVRGKCMLWLPEDNSLFKTGAILAAAHWTSLYSVELLDTVAENNN